MNYLEAIDFVDAPESAKAVLKAMDHLQARGEQITDAAIAKEAQMTVPQVRNILARFRRSYEKCDHMKRCADIISRHFGKKGRKITG